MATDDVSPTTEDSDGARPVHPPDVVLQINGDPALVRVARLTGAAMATRAGLAVDSVEDVRLAIDEVCVLLLECDPPGPVHLEFSLSDGLHVRAWCDSVATSPISADDQFELSIQILRAVVDDLHVDLEHGGPRIGFTKRTTLLDP